MREEIGIKPEVEKDLKAFEREALLELFLPAQARLDVCDDEFGEAHEEVRKYLFTDVAYSGMLTLDLGYRYPFADKASTKDEDFEWKPFEKYYETRNLDVVRVGNVWFGEPYSKAIAVDYMNGKIGADEFCDIKELDPNHTELDEKVLKNAIDRNYESTCRKIEFDDRLPGDARKLKNYVASSSLCSSLLVAEKEQVIAGKKSHAWRSYDREAIEIYPKRYERDECGSMERHGIDAETIEKYKSMTAHTETQKKYYEACEKAKEQKKKVKATYKKMILPMVLGAVLCWVSGWFGGFISTIGEILGALLVLGAAAFPFKGYDFKLSQNIVNLKQQIMNDQKENPMPTKEYFYKVGKLNEILEKRGFEPVSDEEFFKYLATGYKNYDIK